MNLILIRAFSVVFLIRINFRYSKHFLWSLSKRIMSLILIGSFELTILKNFSRSSTSTISCTLSFLSLSPVTLEKGSLICYLLPSFYSSIFLLLCLMSSSIIILINILFFKSRDYDILFFIFLMYITMPDK